MRFVVDCSFPITRARCSKPATPRTTRTRTRTRTRGRDLDLARAACARGNRATRSHARFCGVPRSRSLRRTPIERRRRSRRSVGERRRRTPSTPPPDRGIARTITSSSRPRPSSALPTAPSRASRRTSSSPQPSFVRGSRCSFASRIPGVAARDVSRASRGRIGKPRRNKKPGSPPPISTAAPCPKRDARGMSSVRATRRNPRGTRRGWRRSSRATARGLVTIRKSTRNPGSAPASRRRPRRNPRTTRSTTTRGWRMRWRSPIRAAPSARSANRRCANSGLRTRDRWGFGISRRGSSSATTPSSSRTTG